MGSVGYAFFDTSLGRCGIAWGPDGVRALQLPDVEVAKTRARLLRRAPCAIESVPAAEVQQAIAGVCALLRGERVDLLDVRLDMQGVHELNRRVYDVTRRIPFGRTLSYGQVAERLGDHRLARAVGRALGSNPFAPVVPCHRVLAAGGKLGGFSANGGSKTKLQLLLLERANPSCEPDLFSDAPGGPR
jgi:methylated-DNA-[protein]-cysteine S-methyltransferase